MNLGYLTSKKVQICIKNGLVPEDLMEKYECTEEELKQKLAQLYKEGNGAKAKSVYSELVANRKKARPHAEKSTTVVSEETQIHTEEISETPIAKEPTLADLKNQEEDLSQEVMSLESKYETIKSKRRNLNKPLREKQKEIDQLKLTLEKYYQKFHEIADESDTLGLQMDQIGGQILSKREVLKELRQNIEDMSTIAICVYANGKIEVDNPDVTLNDEGYQEIKSEISEREECLDLRLRDITTLARLLKMTEQIKSKFVLICDDRMFEAAFWTLRNR